MHMDTRILINDNAVSEQDAIYNKLTVNMKLEDAQGFYTEALSEDLVLKGEAYVLLDGMALGDEYNVKIQKYIGTYNTEYEGIFTKTDVEFDHDNGIATVKPTTLNADTIIKDILQKEQNLIEIAPAQVSIQYNQSGQLQLYALDAPRISNYRSGSVQWDSDVANPTTSVTVLKNKGFSLATDISYITTSSVAEINGTYIGTFKAYPTGQTPRYGFTRVGSYWYLENKTTSTLEYRATTPTNDGDPIGAGPQFEAYPTPTGPEFFVNTQAIYSRMLTNRETVDTIPYPSDDLTPEFEADFSHVFDYDAEAEVDYSTDFTTTPTPYGKLESLGCLDDGKYVEPGGLYYPFLICRSLIDCYAGKGFSFWLRTLPQLESALQFWGETVVLDTAYKLPDTIKSLIDAGNTSGSSISHSDSSAWSEFFYSATNPVSGDAYDLILIPTGNVAVGRRGDPAKIANIRLQDITEALKALFNVRYYTEDFRFQLEQERYFHNGGSYTTTPIIGADLTQSHLNGFPFDWNTNKIKYSKNELNERVEIDFSQPLTDVFKGYPVEYQGAGIDKGNIESRPTGKILTDLNQVISRPNEVNKDSFILLACNLNSGIYEVLSPDINFNGRVSETQNGYMSFTDLAEKYYKDNASSADILINQVSTTAETVKKIANRADLFYFANTKPNPRNLIKTSTGNGTAKEINYDIVNNVVDLTIKQ